MFKINSKVLTLRKVQHSILAISLFILILFICGIVLLIIGFRSPITTNGANTNSLNLQEFISRNPLRISPTFNFFYLLTHLNLFKTGEAQEYRDLLPLIRTAGAGFGILISSSVFILIDSILISYYIFLRLKINTAKAV